MSGGAISTTWMSLGVMLSFASIFLRNRKSTANRLGMAMRLPFSSLKCWYGESVRTMITAPERCPRDTILMGIFLSARSITSGASMYAAWIRPAINDSLISGQPLYLLYSYANWGAPPGLARFFAALATQATGSVRLQVTGSPATIRALCLSFAAQDSRLRGR